MKTLIATLLTCASLNAGNLINLPTWVNAPVAAPVIGNVGFASFAQSPNWTYRHVMGLGGSNYNTTGFFQAGSTNAIAMFGQTASEARAWTTRLQNSHPFIPVLVRFEWSWKCEVKGLSPARQIDMVRSFSQAYRPPVDSQPLTTTSRGWQTCSILQRIGPGESLQIKFNCYDGVGGLAGVRYRVIPDLIPGGYNRLGVAGDGWLIIPPGREVQRAYSIIGPWTTVKPWQPWQNAPMEYWRLKL